MNIERNLFEKVTAFIKQRYPSGWGGAAILRTQQGSNLISVALESANASAGLCMETGAMCEAQKLNEKVTHSLCVVRDNETSNFKVLTPCGICQERLLFWGDDVLVGITTSDNTLVFKPLKEINLFHWTNAYAGEKLERYEG